MMTFHNFKSLLETEVSKRKGRDDKGFTINWVSYLVEGSEDFDKGCQDCLMRSFNSVKEEGNYLDEDIIYTIADIIVEDDGVEYEVNHETHTITDLGWRDLDEYLCQFAISEDAPSIVSGRLELPVNEDDEVYEFTPQQKKAFEEYQMFCKMYENYKKQQQEN